VIEIDGAAHSGSGTIVRQAVACAALTGQAVRVRNTRARRRHPGLRPQHLRAIQAISELAGVIRGQGAPHLRTGSGDPAASGSPSGQPAPARQDRASEGQPAAQIDSTNSATA
jgi:RNA 3'-terminal phosphate cyclase